MSNQEIIQELKAYRKSGTFVMTSLVVDFIYKAELISSKVRNARAVKKLERFSANGGFPIGYVALVRTSDGCLQVVSRLLAEYSGDEAIGNALRIIRLMVQRTLKSWIEANHPEEAWRVQADSIDTIDAYAEEWAIAGGLAPNGYRSGNVSLIEIPT